MSTQDSKQKTDDTQRRFGRIEKRLRLVEQKTGWGTNIKVFADVAFTIAMIVGIVVVLYAYFTIPSGR